MDEKALAKSKRAHSLRNTKKNSHHSSSKAPSVSSGVAIANKKTAGEQVGENLQKRHGSRALPSNWDRYDEESNLGSEDPKRESASAPTEFVVPKSKGADYAFLISEAKAQPQLNYSSDIFHSLSDNNEEFTQGFGPMLSVKGQSMLSWIAKDDFDFDFDEKASSSFEAPFLSLNLDALAEQLGKAKLAERLFLGPDVLLPPELLNDELQACSKDNDHIHTSASAVEIDSEGSSCLIQDMGQNEKGQPCSESMSPSSTIAVNNSIAVLKEGFCSMDLNKDSIAETKVLEPSSTPKKSGHRSEIFQENTAIMPSVGLPFTQSTSAEAKKELWDRMKTPMTSVDIEDDIDALKGASNMVKIDGGSLPRGQEFQDITSLQSNNASKSEVLDDFDSWLDSF